MEVAKSTLRLLNKYATYTNPSAPMSREEAHPHSQSLVDWPGVTICQKNCVKSRATVTVLVLVPLFYSTLGI